MKLLIVVGILFGALLGMIAALFVIGLFIPRTHTATRSAKFNAAPEQLWAVINDRAAHPSWRNEVAKVERLPDRNGHEVWREVSKRGDAMPFEITESDPPRRQVTKIDDAKLPFGGTWTWEFVPDAGGTRLRITEDGFIKPPPFRTIMRLMGYSSTIEKLMRALAKKMGQEIVIEP